MKEYLEWSEWVKKLEINKIPFSKYLKLVIENEEYGIDRTFDSCSYEVLAYKYGLELPNRKERQTSVRNWFLNNIDDLTHDDRDALDIMRESKSETLIRKLKQKSMEGYTYK